MHEEVMLPSPNQGYFGSLPEWVRKPAAAALAGLLVMTLIGCETKQDCALNIAQTTTYDLNDPNKTLQQAIDEVPGINKGNCREKVAAMVQRQLGRVGGNRDSVKLPAYVWTE